ncbi:MAG: RNA 2'-phosphotransferase [Oscillospiraceae bacterium]|nr:RNA 2'-phosphotransferase [Oscillospiraceae bacterium]
MDSKEKTAAGKYISLLLRHKPEAGGITLDEHGWADVNMLIAAVNGAFPFGFDMAALEDIVRTDGKQRYSFNSDRTLIRANQGHSIPVDVELPEKEPPELLYHGTGEKFVSSIDKQGLIPKSRLYVHLSKDRDTAVNVGSRHGKPVVYTVKSGEMHRDGYTFYLSVNGVWLTKEVPVRYLEKEQG